MIAKNNVTGKQVGIEWAIQQSRGLKAAGVPVYIIIQWENQYSPKLPVNFFLYQSGCNPLLGVQIYLEA
jgi:hypothetical protein